MLFFSLFSSVRRLSGNAMFSAMTSRLVRRKAGNLMFAAVDQSFHEVEKLPKFLGAQVAEPHVVHPR